MHTSVAPRMQGYLNLRFRSLINTRLKNHVCIYTCKLSLAESWKCQYELHIARLIHANRVSEMLEIKAAKKKLRNTVKRKQITMYARNQETNVVLKHIEEDEEKNGREEKLMHIHYV